MSDVIFRRFVPIGTSDDMDKFTALLVEKNITRDDLLLILRSVKLAVFGSAEEGRDNPEGQLPDPALKQRQYAVLLLAVRPGTWLP